jgi:glycosyltransferase involved in cell wall biosynthesis
MISFIVIGRNESWRLEKCLASIRKTATKELNITFELIYVDSQSVDDSISLSKQFTDKTLLITGVCNAAIGRNIGAKEAKGEILFFLDGDMELREGVLSSILTDKGQLTYPFVSGVEYDYLYDYNWNLKEKRIRRKFIEGEDVYKPTTGGLFVIEKKLWDEVGGMDNRFFRSQDMDFGFRMSAKGIPLLRKGQLWVNHYTVFYAVRNHALSTVKYSALLLRKHFFNKTVQISVSKNNYSSYLLAFTLIFALCLDYPLGLFALIPYLLTICYRTMTTRKRTAVELSLFKTAINRITKDILFIYSFLTFYPSKPAISYREV